MPDHPIVSREEWTAARRRFLAREKEMTRALEALAKERRQLPWVRVEKSYQFQGPDGSESLLDLFAGRSQLLVYHFMFGPDAEEGCPGCSFWADSFTGTAEHIAARDATMLAISRAPLAKLQAFQKRMGWGFKWVSSGGGDFNFDFDVSFQKGVTGQYNYEPILDDGDEGHGISAFIRDGSEIFHTYSCFARGVDLQNAAYQYIDLLPRGRDEDDLKYPSAWFRHRDRYGES